MLTINNTLDGYLKDVEIKGNTIQSASNLADIRSVGDKVEGQELYEIPVLSVGKNLFKVEFTNGYRRCNNGEKKDSNDYIGAIARVKGNTQYYLSNCHSNICYFDSNMKFLSGIDYVNNAENSNGVLTTPTECRYITTAISVGTVDYQLEEGTVATPYEPYQEDKLTILSPVQLEKVGDIADRIICKDGVWGVEKNVGNITLDITKDWRFLSSNNTIWYPAKHDAKIWSQSISSVACKIDFDSANNIVVAKDGLSSLEEYKNIMPIYVKYQLAQPQFIPLPHDQQVKLRTFANKTNISFLTEIEGTIKAQVPKSIGATVNTHTEQINNLNKELDRVKKLEESTVSTVTTESDFTTVEQTSNGYFEDVKLEGKTLVNLSTLKEKFVISANSELNYSAWFNPNQNLKAGKVYTLIYTAENVNETVNTLKCRQYGIGITSLWNHKKLPSNKGNGIFMFTFEPTEDYINIGFYFDKNFDDTTSTATISNVIILEGDHTQNPPAYFEGLKSAGQDVDEVSVESRDVYKQLLYREGRNASYNEDFNIVSIDGSTDNMFGEVVRVKQNTTYTIKFNESSNFNARIYGYETIPTCPVTSPKQQLILQADGVVGDYSLTFTTGIDVKYIFVGRYGGELFNTGYLINHKAKRINEVQLNKKRLLYYNNETQAWEKPILRQWDSIEKHADGKYYYHQRSAEVVLNGSENWEVAGDGETDDIITYRFKPLTPTSNRVIICDKFKNQVGYKKNEEGIYGHSNGTIYISILKTKSPNIEGFKTYLQTNPVTVVYQLAEEKVYECTNIDLITYANETNYVVNSGAIAPRTTLKVHNNISNVVKILQEKVSLLENKFIEGLKQVLAGDMYSLAELLYPEDFVEENPENNIMLLPFE